MCDDAWVHSHRSQSGAQSKKPCKLQGLRLPLGLLSRCEDLVLAEKAGFEPAVSFTPRTLSRRVT